MFGNLFGKRKARQAKNTRAASKFYRALRGTRKQVGRKKAGSSKARYRVR